jgi:uncharacterized membrane protein YeaQ/YmgE (transglycosylase-associated protein family)
MKPIVWTIVACIISWLAAAMIVDRKTSFEILGGMAGPLAAVCSTWLLAVWVQRRYPAALMSLMVTGFAVKLVFFGLYVTVMLRALSLRPTPFVASFTIYFIGLYLTEALYLRRLFSEGMRASR